MPDILIKGMVLPNCCFDCPVFDDFCQERCGVTGTLMYGEIDFKRETLPDCPLVPLPEGHGRLIDADKLAEDLQLDVENDQRALDDLNIVGVNRERIQFDKDCKQNCMWYLSECPTIVPADVTDNYVGNKSEGGEADGN